MIYVIPVSKIMPNNQFVAKKFIFLQRLLLILIWVLDISLSLPLFISQSLSQLKLSKSLITKRLASLLATRPRAFHTRIAYIYIERKRITGPRKSFIPKIIFQAVLFKNRP